MRKKQNGGFEMKSNAIAEEKSNAERIAEEINKVPDDKKEVVSAMLIGICQGVQIADQMQRATA